MLRKLQYLLLASAVLLCSTAPVLTQERQSGVAIRCPLMVKALDAVQGTPAAALGVKVFQKAADGGWTHIASGNTDINGEVYDLITVPQFPAGVYRVEFDTKVYWKNQESKPFYEVAEVTFEAHAGGYHCYTLALLISPSSFTTTAVISPFSPDAHE